MILVVCRYITAVSNDMIYGIGNASLGLLNSRHDTDGQSKVAAGNVLSPAALPAALPVLMCSCADVRGGFPAVLCEPKWWGMGRSFLFKEAGQ